MEEKEFTLLGRLIDIILERHGPNKLMNYLAYVMVLVVSKAGQPKLTITFPIGSTVTVVIHNEEKESIQ